MAKRRKYQPVESSFEQIDSDSDYEELHVQKKSTPPSPSSQLWVDKYAPTSVSEICINPTKLTQVKNALTSMISHRSSTRVLVISGPSGSSKSTTVKLLAKELIPSQDCIVEYNESFEIEDFLNNCRYRVGNNLAVILIEEFPNIYHPPTLEKFRRVIQEWISYDGVELPPLVICLTEVEYGENEVGYSIDNTLNVDTVFGRSLVSQIEVIKFNPIATRFLNKTILNIVKNEPALNKVNSAELKQVLDQLYKVGDIRSIISNLQLWTILKNYSPVSLRENQINLFHALGKILYSSSEFTDNPDFHTINQVLEQFQEYSTINLGLLENYHILSESLPITLASDITNDLSISDLGLPEVGIRSTRVNLRKLTLTSKRIDKVKFPNYIKMNKVKNVVRNQIKDYHRYISPTVTFNDLNMIDGHFLPVIYNRRYNTKRYSYNRLGGKFKTIQDEIPELEYDQFQEDVKRKLNEDVDESEGELSDPIQESEREFDSEDDFSSDPELDFLISQGKI
ncbi:Checkpoint protein RAD24 [Spathaspora sp. JA1]|nr:Checkpoint protein RAD24 [Spathaspora sp. JA1]